MNHEPCWWTEGWWSFCSQIENSLVTAMILGLQHDLIYCKLQCNFTMITAHFWLLPWSLDGMVTQLWCSFGYQNVWTVTWSHWDFRTALAKNTLQLMPRSQWASQHNCTKRFYGHCNLFCKHWAVACTSYNLPHSCKQCLWYKTAFN